MRVQFMGDRLLYCDDNIVRITQEKTLFKKEEAKEIKVSELAKAEITDSYTISFYDKLGQFWDSVNFSDKNYLSMANKIVELIDKNEIFVDIQRPLSKQEQKQVDKIDKFQAKYGLYDVDSNDLEIIKDMALAMTANKLGEAGLNLSFAKSEDTVKIGYLRMLVEQNWVIMNQLGRLNNSLEKLIEK
ncbi:hypothetical protein [Tissierella sp.]|uniref:hypothetical protein n=1 Tax=Tissierella sp. TaxID=41274 RepID=UPI0030407EEA